MRDAESSRGGAGILGELGGLGHSSSSDASRLSFLVLVSGRCLLEDLRMSTTTPTDRLPGNGLDNAGDACGEGGDELDDAEGEAGEELLDELDDASRRRRTT